MALTKFDRKGVIVIASLFILIAANFIYFLPLYMGDLITYEAWRARMWFPSWI
jgi:dolichyl-phosphate-mannose--protein O-mannosyl transferase